MCYKVNALEDELALLLIMITAHDTKVIVVHYFHGRMRNKVNHAQ